MRGTPVRILLARHGETRFNVEGRWQGTSDSPLTERGLAQARELGRALAGDPIAAVYSSDLGRAAQTAAQVAGLHGLSVQTDPRLREIDVGAWTGKSRSEIEAEYPGAQQTWATAPASLRLPGGETLLEAQTRALAFFAEHMPDHAGQTVVVISHGALGQAILVEALGGTVADLWLKERVDNCQISRLEWTEEADAAANGPEAATRAPETAGGALEPGASARKPLASEAAPRQRRLRLIELCDVRHLADVGSLRGWRTDAA